MWKAMKWLLAGSALFALVAFVVLFVIIWDLDEYACSSPDGRSEVRATVSGKVLPCPHSRGR